jgi:gas vesicle protein
MASNDNGGALLLAFIAGAVTGAAVALMFAPAAGDETRELLGARARASRDHLTTAFDRARQQYQQKGPTEEPQA